MRIQSHEKKEGKKDPTSLPHHLKPRDAGVGLQTAGECSVGGVDVTSRPWQWGNRPGEGCACRAGWGGVGVWVKGKGRLAKCQHC